MRSKTYEFKELSDAREVVEHQIPRFMLWFFYFVLATLSLLLVWSYIGTKEIVVQTQGMVKPQATQSVVPLVNSSVLVVHFQEGDFVQAGDLIVELDGRAIESDIANYDAALEQLLTNHQLELLLLESIEIEENLFDVDNLNHITKYYEVEDFLDILELSNNPEQEKRLKKANVRATIDQQAQTISQYENEIEKLEQQLEHYKIYALFDGLIHYVQPLQVGSTVAAGQELLRVHQMEEDDTFTIQFYVLNQDIAQVHVGQRVRVEIPALPARTYGFAEAEVIHIESDSRVDQSSGQSFYLVTARLASNTLSSDNQEESIRIGMQVMGRMITDEQRYLFWAIERLELWIFR